MSIRTDFKTHGLRPSVQAFLERTHGLLIDGKWVQPVAGGRFDVVDPATERVIACVASAEATDVDNAVAAARIAIETGPWGRITPADRSALIWRLADLIEARGEDIAELEVLDNGKPLRDARTDVVNAVAMFRYMAGWPTKLTGETVPVSAPGSLLPLSASQWVS